MRHRFQFILTAVLALFMLCSVAFASNTVPNETVLPYFGVVTPLEVQNMDSQVVSLLAFSITGYTLFESLDYTLNLKSIFDYDSYQSLAATNNTSAFSEVFVSGSCMAITSQSTATKDKFTRWRVRALT